MATEKLSTEEILALARRQDASGDGGGGAAEPSAVTPPGQSAESPPAQREPPPQTPTRPTGAAPQSTADILAAARAQGTGGGTGAAGPKPAATASKPAATNSTADILAAARSQGATGATTRPAAASANPKAAAAGTAKPARAPAAGGHPSVQEMVRAMHQQEPARAVASPAAARPALPGKPPLPKKTEAERISRGAAVAAMFAILLTPFAFGWALMAVIGGLWSLLTARFMMPNMVVELPSKFKVGPPSDFPPGAVSVKFKASRGVWIVNSDAYNGEQQIFALYSVCTHLGCTPNWLEGEQKFKCPCHGSGFYISGINFEGPAPRPLERAGIRLAEDGSLEVDKSVKFQEELGQWQDAKSFFQA